MRHHRRLQLSGRNPWQALVAARRRKRLLASTQQPDMTLLVRRDLVQASGDAAALAAFEVEHAEAIKAQQQAQDTHERELRQLPGHIKALEKIIRELAGEMEQKTDLGLIRKEAERMFLPYAEELKAAGAAFIDALRRARTADQVITSKLRLAEYSIHGGRMTPHTIELREKGDPDDVLPVALAGIPYTELRDLNHRTREGDDTLSTQMHEQRTALGATRTLCVFHASAEGDDRPIFAPDPNRCRAARIPLAR